MGNNGRIAGNQFSRVTGDAFYHVRLLGVLAVLVEHDVWQDALRIVDLLDEKASDFRMYCELGAVTNERQPN